MTLIELQIALQANEDALEIGQKTLNKLYESDKKTGNNSKDTADELIKQNKMHRDRIKDIKDEIKAIASQQ